LKVWKSVYWRKCSNQWDSYTCWPWRLPAISGLLCDFSRFCETVLWCDCRCNRTKHYSSSQQSQAWFHLYEHR